MKAFLLIFSALAIVFLSVILINNNPSSNENVVKSSSYLTKKKIASTANQFVMQEVGIVPQQEKQAVPDLQQDSDTSQNSLREIQKELNRQSDQPDEFPKQELGGDVLPAEREILPDDGYFRLSPDEISMLNESGGSNNFNSANSNLIPGIHRRIGSAAPQPVIEEEEFDNPADAFQSLPKLGGQARGYVMLYLMHPRARATVNAQVEGLVVSGIRNLYLSVLTDGTFGKDFAFLKSTIKKLSDNADSLTLVLYLSNGATMRRFDSTNINAGFNKIDPYYFRDLIRFDTRTKNEFADIIREIPSVFEFNKSLNSKNKNIAIVMLEDNLQLASYVAMRDQAKALLPADVEFIRNPCPGCFEGNDSATDGDSIEIHDPSAVSEILSGGGFTNDGVGYRFSNEPQAANKILLDDLKQQMLIAANQDARYFGLWRAERQGYDDRFLHPDERTYEVPTVNQLVKELNMLRQGLPPLAAKD